MRTHLSYWPRPEHSLDEFADRSFREGSQLTAEYPKRRRGVAEIQLRFGNQTTVIRQRDLRRLLDPDTGTAMLHWLAGIVATLPKGWTVEMKLVECGGEDHGGHSESRMAQG
jgi:hypothetical protein